MGYGCYILFLSVLMVVLSEERLGRILFQSNLEVVCFRMPVKGIIVYQVRAVFQ